MAKKKRRRPRGEGGFRYDARRGLWVGRVPVGRYPNGDIKYREVSDKSQARALLKMRAVGPSAAGVTVEAWAAKWVGTLGVGASSRKDYTDSLRTWVLPAVGAMRVADVRPSHFELLAVRMTAAGREPGTVRKVFAHARIMFTAAVRDGVIASNPVSVARKPKRARPKIEPYTPAELARVVAAATGRRTARVLALLAATGCRAGEAAALDVGDYAPATGMLCITKTHCRRFGTRRPKSANGVRTIRVPEQARAALVAATGGRTTGPVFVTQGGGRVTHSRLREVWRVVTRQLGLPFRKPHTLRHSVGSAMVAAGVPIAEVAKYLGDSVQTIVSTYLHATGGDPAATMEQLLAGG